MSGSSTEEPMSCPVELETPETSTNISPILEKYETALLMLLGFAGFSVMVAVMYNALRKYVFRDLHNLDVVFDAGGRVSLSLTAVTATSQCLWPADFLQSPTVASKTGVAGSLWYTMAVVLSVLMFPVLCVQVKTRAPGAKTYPQIAYARFGKPAHILFCIYALGTNLVITSNIIMAGKTAISVLTKDSSNEFVLLILAVLFGSYCLIGGLGTTFYISYFNTSVIFIVASIFIMKFTLLPEDSVRDITSFENLYEAMSCIKGPEGNYQESLLTFRSETGLIYGVVLLFMTVAIFFCDQATWQSRIAAKPREGLIGFLIAGILWFAIPTSFSFMSSMTYMAMSFRNGSHLLSADDIDSGFITPFVVKTLFGAEGVYLLLTIMTMALMSTGSGEVMSVSSILVYDIIKTYFKPFRDNMAATDCPICGKSKLLGDHEPEACQCSHNITCEDCEYDIDLGLYGGGKSDSGYSCQIHGKYRKYEDKLIRYKSWCMMWVIICIIPLGLLLIETGVNLNWTFMAGQVFIAPFLVPLYITVAWAKATSKAVIAGSILGLICAIVGMLSVGSTYEGGLSDFFVNTTQDYSLLAGLVAGFVISACVSVVISLCAHKIKCPDDVDKEWQKTMSIDNPINPYRMLYKEELDAIDVGSFVRYKDMVKIFRSTRLVSYATSVIVLVLFFIVIPVAALTEDVLSLEELTTWLSACQYWCLTGAFLVVLVPPVEEALGVWRQYQRNKHVHVYKAEKYANTKC